ncbi:DUF4398 domain-containing protein [Methylomarinum sp. Ch1-1]|uniref:DUF4398 domain-containing protein n=1 Tax=Methylomarinum roseum TaxID=3067653 RepID=A0AAU7NUX8_9GAMM|nr:DUF4398 domain-containing protein [Methylomarinum sp. Ch1-1]MDP4519156.1 DUF4398 domain-containing protein [Methylomarinum sp. Ch1-1]
MNKRNPIIAYTAIMVISGITVGCSNGRPPLEKISLAEQALKQAENKNARSYSPLEMRLASEKIEKAKEAIHQKDFETARRLAEKAEIDALAAEAKADSVRAKAAIDELKESIETLRQEIKYSSDQ